MGKRKSRVLQKLGLGHHLRAKIAKHFFKHQVAFQDECHVIHLGRKVLFETLVVLLAELYVDHKSTREKPIVHWVLRKFCARFAQAQKSRSI
ncbi:hypothetical protein ACFZAC_09115 [Pseudomonas fluorescens]|uniref:hypothetical protein n=1 Tax=Pseudomonas fluorescens TaxID=294 RepID=UPI003749F09E